MKLQLIFVIIFITLNKVYAFYHYETKYFPTELDHYSFTESYTFELRYLINDTYWKYSRDGPIFFYTGNEGDIEAFAQNSGFIWETAPEFKAMIVFAEHRYYGESVPFGKTWYKDPKHSGYLSSSQALMDYIKLISKIKDDYKISKQKIPVIAFGGSYGGMLSAWIRMKFPSVIAGSLAASAPIWQFNGMTPCGNFYNVTSSVYTSISSKCAHNIKQSWASITNYGQTDYGRKFLSSTLRTCKPLSTTRDVSLLKGVLKDMYIDVAMVNYPYPTNFIAKLPANPVKAVCKILQDASSDAKLIYALADVVSLFNNGSGKSCLNINGSIDNLGDQGWDYQSCTEMVMPFCDNGINGIFEKEEWDFQKYSIGCYKKYKVRPQLNRIKELFGGKNIKWATNIIFSNGMLDPWSSGGVLNSVSPSAVAILLSKSAHHLDLRSANQADPTSVVTARKHYKLLFRKWIREF